MAWQINYTATAMRELGALEKQVAQRIYCYLQDRVAVAENPRKVAKPMKNKRSFPGMVRFRIGDYRAICEIDDTNHVILVVCVGNRKDVYE